ncbi:MAG: hypothetical protein M3P33_02355, partial [bacterium]|nr:hypothetical protein [bacterium]
MALLRIYIETISLLRSLFVLLTFPMYLFVFSLNALRKRIWLYILSIGIIQMLWSPRFGTNLFSRFGRVLISQLNFNMLTGGFLAGIAILFFLYQPEIRRFDGRFYVVIQQQGVSPVRGEENTALSSVGVIPSSMPITTNVTATPPPAPVKVVAKTLVKQQVLPAAFIAPDIGNTGI